MISIEKILKNAPVLRQQIIVGYGQHGSLKGEQIELKMFWDPFNNVWTSREKALEGYVHTQLQSLIRKLIADMPD